MLPPYLDDYLRMRMEVAAGKSAVVIGGGFIGSEIAAALSLNNVAVTLIFPGPYICSKVFPEALGHSIQERYAKRAVTIIAGDKPTSIRKVGNKFVTSTQKGNRQESDMLIAGIGISPSDGLAVTAGLKVNNGIEVNEYLQTSDHSIFAAGDNAVFPYQALGQPMRLEHWDNALNQGKLAGRNMAGAAEPYTICLTFSPIFSILVTRPWVMSGPNSKQSPNGRKKMTQGSSII